MKDEPGSDIVAAKRTATELVRHLLEILRPLAATDPLVPDICDLLALEWEGCCAIVDRRLTLEYAELALEACLQQRGVSQQRIEQARELVDSYRELHGDEDEPS